MLPTYDDNGSIITIRGERPVVFFILSRTYVSLSMFPKTSNCIKPPIFGSGTPSIATPATSASENTFGSWVEIDSSLSADSYLFGFSFQEIYPPGKYVAEIATGLAASEVTFLRLSFTSDNVYILPIPKYIALGTRLSVRVAGNGLSGGAQAVYVTTHKYTGLTN